MEPISIGILALVALLSGAGAGSAATAHKKNKVIAKLQTEIARLQKEIQAYAERVRKLTVQLQGQLRLNADLENRLLESQYRREQLTRRIVVLEKDKERLESVLVIAFYILTFRWLTRRARVKRIEELRHLAHTQVIQIEKELIQIAEQRQSTRAEVAAIKSDIRKLKKTAAATESEMTIAQKAIRETTAA